MPREGGDSREADRAERLADQQRRATTEAATATSQQQRLSGINTQIASAQAATAAFEREQRAFESQIAALARPVDASQFGQAAPDLSFTPGDFAGPAFDRTPSSGVGLTTAIEASARQGSPTAAFTLSDIQSRFSGKPRGVPRGGPKQTTTRQGGTTTIAPGGIDSPIQRVLGDRTRSRLGGQGKF